MCSLVCALNNLRIALAGFCNESLIYRSMVVAQYYSTSAGGKQIMYANAAPHFELILLRRTAQVTGRWALIQARHLALGGRALVAVLR